MPTIIDSLVVTLGLDAKDFREGQDETAKSLDSTKRRANEAARGITESQTKAQQSFAGTGKQATGAAGEIEKGAKRTNTALRSVDVQASTASKSIASAGKAMLAPFAEFAIGLGAAYLSIDGIKKAISQAGADSAIGRSAQMAGIPVAQFSTFGAASQLLGGDAGAAMGTLASLAQQQQAASLGQISPAMALLESLGIKPNQSVPDIMKALNRRLQGMPAARQSYILGQLGVDPGTAFLEEQTPAKYDATLAQAAKDQINPTQFSAEQGVTRAYAGVIEALDNLGRDVTVGSAPALTQMLNGLKDFITWVDAHGAKWFYDHFSNKAIVGEAKGAVETAKAWAGDAVDFVLGARGVRNNNPLNLKYAGQPGAHADSDGFAVFGSMNDGIRADYHQLLLDYNRGGNTINKLVPMWTTTDRAAYAATVLQQMKRQGYDFTGDTPIDMNNTAQAQALISSMSVAEGNGRIWNNTPPPGSLPKSVNSVLTGLRSKYKQSSGGGSTTHISVTVNAPSGDPHAIAHVVKRELQKQTTQAKNSVPGSMQ